MITILKYLSDWSEAWALLIPLGVLLIKKQQPKYLKPVIIFVWLSFLLGICIDLGYNYYKSVPKWLYPNNYLYNILSIVRFTCLSSFFIMLRQPFLVKLKKLLPIFSLAFIIFNFSFTGENFFNPNSFSSRLFAVEAGILMFYCLQYYLFNIYEEKTRTHREPAFWVVTGLSIYVVFNFIYFLFYSSLVISDVNFVTLMWHFHNLSFIIFSIFIAKAFLCVS